MGAKPVVRLCAQVGHSSIGAVTPKADITDCVASGTAILADVHKALAVTKARLFAGRLQKKASEVAARYFHLGDGSADFEPESLDSGGHPPDAISAIGPALRYQTALPTKWPMPAVTAIAAAPQKATRAVARGMAAPPALAPSAPSTARKTSEAADTE